MVEVFKTNVTARADASRITGAIHDAFGEYAANFDLHDCDNILRIQSVSGVVDAEQVMHLLKYLGFEAEVLPDEMPAAGGAAIQLRETA